LFFLEQKQRRKRVIFLQTQESSSPKYYHFWSPILKVIVMQWFLYAIVWFTVEMFLFFESECFFLLGSFCSESCRLRSVVRSIETLREGVRRRFWKENTKTEEE
jgi:hypothetical protein